MQHFLKSSTRTTRAKIIPTELLVELFVSVYYPEAAFHFGFRRETSASFAAWVVEKIRFSRESLLPDGFARHITEKGELMMSL
jgi:hypothetical protein